jgi:hypothetical protein
MQSGEGIRYILSLDLRDAFGNVPHDLIEMNLRNLGIPENIKNLISNSYKDVFIQIQTKGGSTGRINIEKGVKQGYPLSLTLLNIGLDPLLRFLGRILNSMGINIARMI